MKKKILSLCLCVSLIALLIAGGTLAYFTDTATADNVMTAGNVEIDLHESNNKWKSDETVDYDYDKQPDGSTPVESDADYEAWLAEQPFVPMSEIEKDVWVENTGEQPLYTRVHIAVPTGAYDNAKTADENIVQLGLVTDSGWTLDSNPDTDGVQTNEYDVKIDGFDYDVIVLTYTTELKKGEKTPICLTNVKMNEKVKCSNSITVNEGEATEYSYVEYTLLDDEGAEITSAIAEDGLIHVMVFAEAGQQYGFTDAYAALNAQFGNPADADYESPFTK